MTNQYLRNAVADHITGTISACEGIRNNLVILNGPIGCKTYYTFSGVDSVIRRSDLWNLRGDLQLEDAMASTRYINYSEGNGFEYVIPHSIEKDPYLHKKWVLLMENINNTIRDFTEHGIPVEDATMLLPLAYSSKMVDKRNLRNLVDMSRQRMCSRAYWEYRELFDDICNALREYSDEWKWIVDNLFHAKCDEVGFCTETKSCGKRPKLETLEN